MTSTMELIQQDQREQIWSKHCGHFDLTIDEFMQIQERLLFEQFEILKDSQIGVNFFGKKPPKTIKEFREKVPLTTYEDYLKFFSDRNEEYLPNANYHWARTSGRSGQYECKWVPLTDRMYERMAEVALTAMIIASASYKGDVKVKPRDVLLLGTAPKPYISGYLSDAVDELLDVEFIPPLKEADKMEFAERLSVGFRMGMSTGIDYFYGLASILAKMGERFEQGGGASGSSIKGMKLSTIIRLLKGFLISKLQRRPLLPKDIWKLKGIMAGGMDTDIYREKVKHYWGKHPVEGYACTEGGMQCTQGLNFRGMTFFPDINFMEFIPFEEHLKNKEDPSYKPKTLLINELKPGGIYEYVFTNLLGGVMMRYRVGDLFEVISIGDDEIDCKLPQFKFFSRADDLIDLGSMIRYTEGSIWQAIKMSGVDYQDWVARKEVKKGKPYLHLYLEFKTEDHLPLEKVEKLIENELKKIHTDYDSLVEIMGDNSFKVSSLPCGAFDHYIQSQKAAGADLAHIKPPHMQPKDHVFEKLKDLA